ncbi:MAG TPA: TonB-dependent receptor [Vicinamibacterales bacterium]|nr:TonB-dependent receptor [Vicinamibacterales bacterium]
MNHWLTRAAAALLVFVGISTPSFAQIQSGEIHGRVTDASGAVLPGVTVTVAGRALIQPEVTITTETGAYSFPRLPVGTYSVRFELGGFRQLVQEGVQLQSGFSAQINAKLELSTVQETVTVTGASPVVDTKQTTTGATFTTEVLQGIPTARDPWVLLEQTPGVVMNQQNVGGNKSGQQSTFTVHGTQQGNSIWNVDGVTITDMAATGSSSVYFDFDSFQEISFTTGGADASVQTGGVNLNFITRSGGNVMRGSGRYFVSDNNYQSKNITDALRAQGAGSGNPLKNIQDYGVEIGGPILKNKVWFWGAYGKQDIEVGVIGFLKKGATDGSNPDNLETDLTVLENYNLKLNAQPSRAQRFSFLYTFSDKIRNARGAGPLNPPETTFRQSGPTPIWKVGHQWVASDRLLLDTTYGFVDGGFRLDFHEDALADVQRLLETTNAALARSNQNSINVRPQNEIKTDGNYFSTFFGADHALKFGARWRDTPFNTGGHIGGFVTGRLLNGVPIEADLHRDNNSRTSLKSGAVYLQDAITTGRLTINAGVRVDYHRDKALAAEIGANPIVPDKLPALKFPGADSGVSFTDISPRFGATWDLTGGAKSILKVSANRFYGQFVGTAAILNPVGATLVRYPWTDLNGDLFVQRNELDLNRLLTFSANYNPNNPANVVSSNRVDPNLKNDIVNEVIAGVDHELMDNFGIGLAYIHRRIGRFTFNVPEGLSPSMFNPVTFTANCGNTSCAQPSFTSTYYTLASPLPTTRVETNQDFRRYYHGLELTARKRMSNRWMLNGSMTLNSATYHSSPEGYQDTIAGDIFAAVALPMDPTNRQFIEGEQTLINGSRWVAKLAGMYQLPWGVNLGGTLNAREGFPFIPNILSPNRPNGLGTIRVMVEPYATSRYDSLALIDLKAEKRFTFDRLTMNASVDVFNVGNANTVLNRVTTQNSATANRVTEVTGPRVLRFGLRFQF